VWRGLLDGDTGGDALTGLLSARQTERRPWNEPVRQDCKGLLAGMTDSAPHPDAFMAVIVGQSEPPSVAGNRVLAAKRASPRQKVPTGSPRVDVVFRFWQCDKENHGWREGPPRPSLLSFDQLAGPSPSGKVSFERKKNTAFRWRTRAPTHNIGRLLWAYRTLSSRLPSGKPVRRVRRKQLGKGRNLSCGCAGLRGRAEATDIRP
jgi:hypothetical protein